MKNWKKLSCDNYQWRCLFQFPIMDCPVKRIRDARHSPDPGFVPGRGHGHARATAQSSGNSFKRVKTCLPVIMISASGLILGIKTSSSISRDRKISSRAWVCVLIKKKQHERNRLLLESHRVCATWLIVSRSICVSNMHPQTVHTRVVMLSLRALI